MSEFFEPVIGLEIHIELLTKSKMFCYCHNTYGEKPNTAICPICTGQPGTLPLLNKEAIFLGLRAALAFGCNINEISIFERKNYFYPDLPKSYQISQYEKPFSTGGAITIIDENEEKTVALERIHFEEDAGKLIHVGHETKVDFNRAGVPLIEIVTKPVINSPKMATLTLKWLKLTLEFLSVSDCKMEEGSFRCDANISVKNKNDEKLGPKIELKNINSFKFIEKALQYEIQRQIEILSKGGHIIQETRLWNVEKNISETMREKEEADDYRYFPEPDLNPLIITEDLIKKVKNEMPQSPLFFYKKLKNYGLTHNTSMEILSSPSTTNYYFEALSVSKNPLKTANWLLNDLTKLFNRSNLKNCPLTSSEFGELIKLLCEEKINSNTAKNFLREIVENGKSLNELKNVETLSYDEVTTIVKSVLKKHPNEVNKFKAGKKNLFSFFIGQIMKETHGKGDPAIISEILKKLLN